jgi:hypothetical protein
MLGDAGADSYLRGSAIHESYYRCVSIHGTNRAEVDDNVAYDITGHCFYLEDGTEQENRITNNLAALVHFIGKPARDYFDDDGGQFLTTVDADPEDLTQPADITAGGFYISNKNNWVEGNAASGGWASFGFPTLSRPIGLNAGRNFNPSQSPTLSFKGNSAHSSAWWWRGASVVYGGGSLFGNPLKYNAGRRGSFVTSYQNGVRGFIKLEDTLIFISRNIGLAFWGSWMETLGLGVHDVRLGGNVLGVHQISHGVITCRTGDPLLLPCAGCETDPAKAGAALRAEDAVLGFKWYDIGMQHILTNVTFRRCGKPTPSTAGAGCGDLCPARSSTWAFNAGSDYFTPHFLQATRDIRYQDCGRVFSAGYITVTRNGLSSPQAWRYSNWLDVDGSRAGPP